MLGRMLVLSILILTVLLASATAGGGDRALGLPIERSADDPVSYPPGFHCYYQTEEESFAEFQAAVARGEIRDPATRSLPAIPPGPAQRSGFPRTDLNTDDIFIFEDTDEVLLTDWTLPQMFELMVSAANDLMSVHGDLYDFISFYLNFDPHHLYGGAFYWAIENDVTGIGKPLINRRPEYGLGGENIEGMVMWYNINSYYFEPPPGEWWEFTNLMLGHEFEHRFAMALPDLLDGREMQGDAPGTVGGPCGKEGHWSYRVDAQGSGMEVAEWYGPDGWVCRIPGSPWSMNLDIGGVFSYPDLYLMGYVSPEEMDAGPLQLRHITGSDSCDGCYNGPEVSHFSSADIIAAAGPRVPNHEEAQKHFRTGWVVIHLPGDPPDQQELEKAVAIMEAHQESYNLSTLGRGTMDNSLYDFPTVVGGIAGEIISQVRLAVPEPSPMNASGVLRFSLPAPDHVELAIHDVAGRRVATLLKGEKEAGKHSFNWDGHDDSGAPVPPGVYFARLVTSDSARAVKVLVTR